MKRADISIIYKRSRSEWYLTCEQKYGDCTCSTSLVGNNRVDLVKSFQEENWKIIDGKVICDDCLFKRERGVI